MSLVVVLMFAMTLATGAFLILTPRLMPITECFAVTVPHGAREQEPLTGYMRTYTRWMTVVVILCALAWPLVFVLGLVDLDSAVGLDAFALLIATTTCVPMVVSLVLMLHFRKRVQAHKAAQGWHANNTRSVAFVGPEDFPRPIPLAVNLAYAPLVVAAATFALVCYDDFPAQIPMHVDFFTVTSYADKSLVAVLFPVFLTAFLGLVFTFCHWGIIRSKKPIDPSAPASSALAYGRFARTQSIFLFAGGVSLSAVTCVSFFACAMGNMLAFRVSMVVLMLIAAGLVVAMLVISMRMGQVGALVAAAPDGADMPRDDDKYWPMGMFYCNANDPSIFVPKRFGVGWTLNMARPAAWAWFMGILLLAAGFCWTMATLTS